MGLAFYALGENRGTGESGECDKQSQSKDPQGVGCIPPGGFVEDGDVGGRLEQDPDGSGHGEA